MEALNIGISYVLDFVSQLWSCKTNLHGTENLAYGIRGYERGTRRGEGKEGRVENKERRAVDNDRERRRRQYKEQGFSFHILAHSCTKSGMKNVGLIMRIHLATLFIPRRQSVSKQHQSNPSAYLPLTN